MGDWGPIIDWSKEIRCLIVCGNQTAFLSQSYYSWVLACFCEFEGCVVKGKEVLDLCLIEQFFICHEHISDLEREAFLCAKDNVFKDVFRLDFPLSSSACNQDCSFFKEVWVARLNEPVVYIDFFDWWTFDLIAAKEDLNLVSFHNLKHIVRLVETCSKTHSREGPVVSASVLA